MCGLFTPNPGPIKALKCSSAGQMKCRVSEWIQCAHLCEFSTFSLHVSSPNTHPMVLPPPSTCCSKRCPSCISNWFPAGILETNALVVIHNKYLPLDLMGRGRLLRLWGSPLCMFKKKQKEQPQPIPGTVNSPSVCGNISLKV